jgi:hypothetical protein
MPGGQRFEPAAVHHHSYACLQGFRDFAKPSQAPPEALRQTFCKRTGWQWATVAGSRWHPMTVASGHAETYPLFRSGR